MRIGGFELADGMGRLGAGSAFEAQARARELERQGRDVIRLGIGPPDFGALEHVVEASGKARAGGRRPVP